MNRPLPPWFQKAREMSARTGSRPFLVNRKDKTAELYVYDQIGADPWTGEGVTAKAVVDALAANRDASETVIHVNSPGGDVFEGTTIANAIRAHPGKKTIHVDGVAASIASIIALAGDKVITNDAAMWMIHEPASLLFVMGDADSIEEESRRSVAMLRKARENILDTYVRETGKSLSDLSAMLKAETWMTAADALAHGFTDEIASKPAGGEPENAVRPASAQSAPARPSPRVEAELARARVRSLSEQYPRPAGAQGTGQPVKTTNDTKGGNR